MSAPWAGASTSAAKGIGGIDPVPPQPDIGVAAFLARDLEPVDEFFVAFAGLQRVQHLDPGRQDQLGAPVDAARRRIDARARGAIELRGLVVEPACAARATAAARDRPDA